MSKETTELSTADLRALLDDDPAAGLARVADLMRQRAEAATEGTWGLGFGTDIVSGIKRTGRGSYGCDHHIARVLEEFDRDDDVENDADSQDDAEHIVAMANPVMALAVAEWLEGEASRTSGAMVAISPHALATARAYLAADIEEG